MAQHKKKAKIEAEKKSKVQEKFLESNPPSEDDSALIGQKVVEIWKSEISQLQTMQFASLEEASEVVIDKVLDRLRISDNSRADTKNFLLDMIDGDPEFEEEMRRVLRIK